MHLSYFLTPALLALTAFAQPTGPNQHRRPAHPHSGTSHPHAQGAGHEQHPMGANHHRRPAKAGGNAHPSAHPPHPHPQGAGHQQHPMSDSHHRRPAHAAESAHPSAHPAHPHPQGNGQNHRPGNPHQGNGQGQSQANAHPSHPHPSSGHPHPQGNGQHSQSQGGGSQASGNGGSFAIHVVNKCRSPVDAGIFGVSSTYQAQQHGHTFRIPSDGSHVLHAPFHGTGLRLSAEANQGSSAAFNPQLLFEFGYSSYQGVDGTSYDISMMHNANAQFGMAVHPLPNGRGSQTCESKLCTPGNCPLSQGWTNPDQINDGSPADTTCYKGKTNFQVIYCPSG